MEVKIKYFNKNMTKLEAIAKGDWIDMRARAIEYIAPEYNEELGKMEIKKVWHDLEKDGPFMVNGQGEIKVYLGVAMELPAGFEALVIPRGSTFHTYGVLQVNSPGLVDNTYRGNDDEWFVPYLTVNTTYIAFDDRICQFRIQSKMPTIEFNEVEKLEGPNRGSYGSTGTK